MEMPSRIRLALRAYERAEERRRKADATLAANKDPRRENDLANDLNFSEERADQEYGALYRIVSNTPGWQLCGAVPTPQNAPRTSARIPAHQKRPTPRKPGRKGTVRR